MSLTPTLTQLHTLLLAPKVYNEAASPFYEANSNSKAAAAALAELSEDDQAEANKKYSINGFIYCNLPGLNMTTGQR
jgi:hephaestin